jgi:hypothetical protein
MKYVVLTMGILFCSTSVMLADGAVYEAIGDTELGEEEPGVNKGGGSNIQIGGTWGEDTVWLAKGLFEFVPIYTLPEYTTIIDQAILKLYLVGNDLGEAPIDFFTVAEEWNEMSVTWNTRPGENRGIIVTDTAPPLEPPATLWEIDVTEIVRTWYGYDPIEAYGFYIDVPDNGISVDIDIASRENPDSLLHPKLWVNCHTEGVIEDESADAITLDVSSSSAGHVEIRFNLPACTGGSLKIYDASGVLVETLVDGSVHPGDHRLIWNGTPGVYFVLLKIGSNILVRKAVILE